MMLCQQRVLFKGARPFVLPSLSLVLFLHPVLVGVCDCCRNQVVSLRYAWAGC